MNQAARIVVFASLLSVAMPMTSSAQVIGVFADLSATECDLSVHRFAPATGYLLFRRGVLDGIIGFEFRIEGLPQGWIATTDYCWGVICVGDLFGNGDTWAWPTCRREDPVAISRITFIATTEETDVILRVAAKVPPSNPAFDCPLVVQCDAPAYTLFCVGVQPAVINGSAPCIVSVEQRTWTQIRRLYD